VSIPLFDLSRQSPLLREAMEEAVHRVLDHQQFILGKEVLAFEEEIAASCLGKEAHTIGVSSGTDGLLALLMAKQIGAEDAIITTPYTFFATAGCVQRVGAELLFCDIDPQTYMMDPQKLQQLLASLKKDARGDLRTARGNRVCMIIPVHLFGTCCDMDAIMALAQEYGLEVIEDAAQVIGADYPSASGAKKAGAIGEMSYFSFYPSKNLGAAGDAGLAACRDADMADKVRSIRNHGMEERYYHKVVGGNFRLDGLQAAILRTKLPFLQEWSAQRRANAALYKAAFSKAGLLDRITLPVEPWVESGLTNHHIYHQYVIRVQESASGKYLGARENIIAHFTKKNIGHAIYYPVPLHLQECFASLGYSAGDFPESETAAKETLALPIFPELREEEINAVVEAIAEALHE